MIYLDHASHTQADSAVLAEFCRVEAMYKANPLSAHSVGRAAKAEFDRITGATAKFLGAKPEEVIFTSGATEANSLAVNGLARAYRHVGRHIITNNLEHPSVSGPLAVLKEQGYEVELADILPDGTVDLDHLGALLRPDTILVTAPWVDSELGAIQPIQTIGKLLEKHPNCRFHVDAAQAVGKIPVSFDKIDTLSLSPHKFHGICGIGVLMKSQDILLDTSSHSGTPALALATSAYKALDVAISDQTNWLAKVKRLRKRVIEVLEQYTKVRINSPKDGSPYILNLSVQGIKGGHFQAALDKHGVCVSVKSACSAQGTPSRPVFAISRDKKNAMCSWRISFSHCTEMADTEGFLSAFDACYKELV